MEIVKPPKAPKMEDFGRGGARWMGRGQSWSVQLYSHLQNFHHGFSQEGLFVLYLISLLLYLYDFYSQFSPSFG